MKNNNSWAVLLALSLLISCRVLQRPAVLYQHAILNSMAPDSSKIYNRLISTSKQNKNLVWKSINGEDYLLVVTWKQNVSYYQKYLDSSYYNTGPYQIWVTIAPEL